MTIAVEYSSPSKKPPAVKLNLTERELNSKLTNIFTKIGSPDTAQEGIQELHNLLLEYPECDNKVNTFLSSAGTFFQKYIRKALAEITILEMQKYGMVPNEPQPESAKTAVSQPVAKPKTMIDETAPIISPPLTPMTKALTEKVSLETFEQTRLRLHSIFQYEKYKSGVRRSSLPNLNASSNDKERLELFKNLIRLSCSRRSSWVHGSSVILGNSKLSKFDPLPRREVSF